MSAAKHTPGPWVSDFNRDTGVDGVALTFAIHGGEKSYITSGQSAEHLKTDGQCDDPILAAECEANAHLIAAAPELLKAMQASVELADRNMAKSHANGVMTKRSPEAQAVYEQCVAAIAKATGAPQ